ncbi:MAG: polymer-forming cytoskeletal protein [Magnetococcales bacterium]|nr:polymer-forming cytoskeletal protein [Magnetococcales bacterium]
MALFHKNKEVQQKIDEPTPALAVDKPIVEKPSATTIAAGTRIKGEIATRCNLQMDGEFEGQITSESLVMVGKSGRIEGHVHAKKFVVCGHFHGQAECDEIEILAGGNATGQLLSSIMVIERGSFFEGESRLRESTSRATPAQPLPPVATPVESAAENSPPEPLPRVAPSSPPPQERKGTVYSNTDLLNDPAPPPSATRKMQPPDHA